MRTKQSLSPHEVGGTTAHEAERKSAYSLRSREH